MPLVAWIVIGLLAGLASFALPGGRAAAGCLVTGFTGLAGALAGGAAATLLGFGGVLGGLDPRNLAVAALAAAALLLALRLWRGRSGRRRGEGQPGAPPDGPRSARRAWPRR